MSALSDDVENLLLAVHGDGNGRKGLRREMDDLTRKIDLLLEESKDRKDEATFIRRAVVGGVIALALEGAAILGIAGFLVSTRSAPPINNSDVNTVTIDGKEVKPTATDYNTTDLCEILDYKPREIQDRAAKGEIPGAYKDGRAWRFNRAAVDAWLAAKAADAAKAANAATAAPTAP